MWTASARWWVWLFLACKIAFIWIKKMTKDVWLYYNKQVQSSWVKTRSRPSPLCYLGFFSKFYFWLQLIHETFHSIYRSIFWKRVPIYLMTRFLNIACIILLGSEPYIAILNAIKKEHIYSYMKTRLHSSFIIIIVWVQHKCNSWWNKSVNDITYNYSNIWTVCGSLDQKFRFSHDRYQTIFPLM